MSTGRIAELLHEAAETHHRVYRITDGEDADWASWYADWLIRLSELPDLLDAVRRVADGDVVFSPRLAGFVLDAFAAGAPTAVPEEEATDPGLDLLSAREREVMQLLARGYTYREIGQRLFISVKTVESHASNVLRKLQLSNRNELTRWAATNRLL